MNMPGIRTVAVAFALLAFSGTALADLSDGLVVKYSFDSLGTDGQLADESGNGHTLTLGSGLSLTNGPMPGMKAIRFDGTSDAWAQYAGSALTNRTVSFWTRFDAANSTAISGVPYVLYGLGTLNVYNAGGAGKTSTDETFVIGGNIFSEALTFPRNVWQHHVMTFAFDDDNCQVGGTFAVRHYVDGRLVYESSGNGVTARADKETEVFIGNRDRKDRATLGNLSDFRVWNRALSAEEVNALYAETTLGRDPVLVAYWPLDEITETGGVRTSPNKAECDFTTFPDLTIEGESMVQTNGLFGNAVFAGRTACGRMKADNDLEGGLTDWSLSLWMKAPFAPTHNSTQRFIETQDSARMLTFMGYANLQQQLRWHLGYGRGGTPYWTASSALFCTNVWLNVTFVQSFEVDGTNKLANFNIYVNGEKLSTSFSQGTSGNREIPNAVDYVNWRDTAIRIGGRHETSPDTNDSTIDEVAVFSGALNDEQVESLYRGSPAVDAGDDFSTKADAARLEGRVVRHASSITVPKPGQYAWRLVSAPPGGEGATFLGADGLAATVTLPVVGAYVFELRCTDSLLPRKDTVTVTRVAAGGANVAPTVALAATAAVTLPAPLTLAPTVTDADGDATVQRWRKVSGPGGVWFDPQADGSTRVTFGAAGEYVVRLVASDGTDEATADCTVTVAAAEQELEAQLLHYWGLNTNRLESGIVRDEVSGQEISAWWNYPVKTFATGVTGYAFEPSFAVSNIYWDTGTTLDETPTIADKANSRPTTQYVTVSAWVYVRPNDTNNVAGGIVAGQRTSWYIEYSRPDNPNSFSIHQQGDGYREPYTSYGSISYSTVNFPAPATPYAGRWTHVAAVLDRWGAVPNVLYVDGVKQTHFSYEKSQSRAGRPTSGKITIGGFPWTSTTTTTRYNGNYTDGDDNPLSRCFPGIIDEVKIWKRKLSDAEIAYLAATPAEQNREPQVDVPAQAVIRVGVHAAAALAAPVAYDDGLPTGSVLSGEWQVVAGDASAVTFGNGAVTVDAEGEYVVRYAATDGERTSYSEPVTVIGIATGTMLIFR